MIRLILSVLALSTTAQATAEEFCSANFYFTTAVADNSFFSPAGCGKVNFTQKWSATCVDAFVKQAYWHGNLSNLFTERSNRYTFKNGYVSYFLVEYQPEQCGGTLEVNTDDAMFMGLVQRNGRTQKLYGVLDAQRNFNVLVLLSRGINVTFLKY